MSADNTIIILSLKDCHIVNHMSASDNLYFTYAPKYDNSPVSARIYEYFIDSKNIFVEKVDALVFADSLYSKIGYVEYGIQKIDLSQYTWKDIKIQTREILINEIYILKNSGGLGHAIKECRNLLNLIDEKLTIQKWKEIKYT